MERRTIDFALRWAVPELHAAGIESPALEAQLLLAHALERDRLHVLSRSNETLSSETWGRFVDVVARRAAREPLAYIRGKQEFYGLTFQVNPSVLIPRPETELLVEMAIRTLAGRSGTTLVDVGSGSGCIGMAAAVHLPQARVWAIDISPEAVQTARRNAAALGVDDRFTFLAEDFRQVEIPAGVEMIVSNPPYIPSVEIDTLQPEVRCYEPRGALDGGVSGLDFYSALAELAAMRLGPGGTLAVEVGAGQAPGVAALFGQAGLCDVRAERDLQGIERVVHGRKPQ